MTAPWVTHDVRMYLLLTAKTGSIASSHLVLSPSALSQVSINLSVFRNMSSTNRIVNDAEVRHRDVLCGTRDRSGCHCQSERAVRPTHSALVRLSDLITALTILHLNIIIHFLDLHVCFYLPIFHFLLGNGGIFCYL